MASSADGAYSDQKYCPVYEAINLLQEKWALHIIRSLLSGPKGFNELARAVGGCNPATMAQRLEKLVSIGVVSKTVESTMPPKTCYALTKAGKDLQGVVDAIEHWGRKYLDAKRIGNVF